MIIEVNPSDPTPIYQQIVAEVRRGLVMGLLQPDDSLPSVRTLAAGLRVNPNTVQQAYRELEREGVVYVQRGLGTFVAQNAAGDEERQELALAVARRALRDADRHGLSLEELVESLRRVAGQPESREQEKG